MLLFLILSVLVLNKSPDINPREYLRADLKRRVQVRQPINLTELHMFYQAEWARTKYGEKIFKGNLKQYKSHTLKVTLPNTEKIYCSFLSLHRSTSGFVCICVQIWKLKLQYYVTFQCIILCSIFTLHHQESKTFQSLWLLVWLMETRSCTMTATSGKQNPNRTGWRESQRMIHITGTFKLGSYLEPKCPS